MKTRTTLLAILAALALGLGVVACGSDDEESGDGGGGGGGGGGGSATGNQIQKVPGAASKGTITIGSKNFPEQYILGNLYADALAAAGFKVKKSLDIGSEVLAYKSLQQGEIDGYPEYTGTALTAFFQVPVNKVPKDAQAAFDDVKQKLAAKQITALPQTPFENTYRLAMTKAKYKEIGSPKTNSELKGKEGDLTIAGFPECKQRIDCLLGLRKVYGLKFGKFIASQQQYDVLDNGSADVLFGFTTDGELTTGKYALLDDDKHLWPPYHVSLLIRDEALKKLGPEGQKVIEDVQKPLTEKVMGELNSRVVLDKQEPEKVAADYLKEAGFTK
jgi:glycine betaine/choline ABC-type transport system substrate-binding protein